MHMQKEQISHEDPQGKQKRARVDTILSKIKRRFRLTKINAQLDEIKDWVFEMIPELVLVMPNGSDVSHFDHFENEKGLFQSILRYLRRLYNSIESGSQSAYGTVPLTLNEDL